jgi:hypothetical protein
MSTFLPQTCAAACIPAPCPRARAYDRQAGYGTISSAKGEANIALHDEVYLILADSLVADEQQVFADLIVAYQVPQQPNYVYRHSRSAFDNICAVIHARNM